MDNMITLCPVKTEARVDSRLLAEHLGIQHKNVLELVDKYPSDFEEFGTFDFQSRKSGGRATEFAELNEDQAYLLLIFSRNTERQMLRIAKVLPRVSRTIRNLGLPRIFAIRNLEKPGIHIQPANVLTRCRTLLDNRRVINALMAGRRNPLRQGVKAPRFIAAFLCPSFRPAASRAYSVMAGCFGQRSALAAPCRGFSTPLQPVAHAVESMTGGLSIRRQGFTA